MSRHENRSAQAGAQAPQRVRPCSLRVGAVGAQLYGDARPAEADERELSLLAWLICTLNAAGIRFQVAIMSAAALQSVFVMIRGTCLRVDLRHQQCLLLLPISRQLDATIMTRTLIGLSDETIASFVCRVGGLRLFDTEGKCVEWRRWHGVRVQESFVRGHFLQWGGPVPRKGLGAYTSGPKGDTTTEKYHVRK